MDSKDVAIQEKTCTRQEAIGYVSMYLLTETGNRRIIWIEKGQRIAAKTMATIRESIDSSSIRESNSEKLQMVNGNALVIVPVPSGSSLRGAQANVVIRGADVLLTKNLIQVVSPLAAVRGTEFFRIQ